VATYPHMRLRRTRRADWSRRLVRENTLTRDDLTWTIVLSDGDDKRAPVPSMPGVDRVNLDEIVNEAKRARELGIPAIALFPHINPKFKDATASEALNPKGLVPEAVRALETAKHKDVMIMSYAAKYASGFYGPYRDAIGTASALKGDKRTYQMDPGNSDEALREVEQDILEGADMVMVKPGSLNA